MSAERATLEDAISLIMAQYEQEYNMAKTKLALLVLIGEVRREAYDRGYQEGAIDTVGAVLA